MPPIKPDDPAEPLLEAARLIAQHSPDELRASTYFDPADGRAIAVDLTATPDGHHHTLLRVIVAEGRDGPELHAALFCGQGTEAVEEARDWERRTRREC